MSDHVADNESPAASLKSEAARQRWEMFHRAIAHAKQTNLNSLEEAEGPVVVSQAEAIPFLTVVK